MLLGTVPGQKKSGIVIADIPAGTNVKKHIPASEKPLED